MQYPPPDLTIPETIPLASLFKFITPFDGKREELAIFLRNVNSAMRIAVPSQEANLLAYVLTQIRGTAGIATTNKHFPHWQSLYDFLNIHYSDTKHNAQLMCELMEIRQNKDETLSKFIERFELLVKRLTISVSNNSATEELEEGRLDLLNELALTKFIHFTNPQISNRLRGSKRDNLNEAFPIAQAEENSLKLINQTQNSSKNSSKTFEKLRRRNLESRTDDTIIYNYALSHDNAPVKSNITISFTTRIQNKTKTFIILLDTGATVSLLKYSSLASNLSNSNLQLNSNDTIKIKGIVAPAITTLGSIILRVQLHKLCIPTKFHVVDNQINLPYDGVLGTDFLQNNNATIFRMQELHLHNVSIPLNNRPPITKFVLKPRTEMIVPFLVQSPEISEGLIPEMKTLPGIYVSRALTKVLPNSLCLGTILNATDKERTYTLMPVTLLPFSEPSILKSANQTATVCTANTTNSSNSTISRAQQLISNLRLDHPSEEERTTLLRDYDKKQIEKADSRPLGLCHLAYRATKTNPPDVEQL
ncbi:hypothetical protein ILUMI_01471 [Ignelater luminosus]|uniref:Retrotransposon gag domain-containing protein n=1 Tax=Ignelater luminosus TaxID=2038154 RepID=A0A8K0DK36_IGNLU|nr:hypothetical protein ILUMI_01471 [Ignelater luminosus]